MVDDPLIRITPTYMGNTNHRVSIKMFHQDHPHIHGEYEREFHTPNLTRGSPPHTWGIHLPVDIKRIDVRITPTYMGNTESTILFTITGKDHPHIHGEYPGFRTRTPSRARITPTYMGNTYEGLDLDRIMEDHPHIHGEYVAHQRLTDPP